MTQVVTGRKSVQPQANLRGGHESVVRASFQALGTDVSVAVIRPADLAESLGHVQAVMDRVDRSLSRFRRDSELCVLETRTGAPCAVSPLFWEACMLAGSAFEATHGWFDVTVRDAVEAAGYDRSIELIERDGPGPDRDVALGSRWSSIQFDSAAHTILLPPGVGLDFGGIGKGLAVDLAIRTMPKSVAGVCVNAGGDIAVTGRPPDGGWAIGIAADTVADEHAQVALHAGALATSGLGRRQWARNGQLLHHLINPHSRRPGVSSWRSVTVAAATCTAAEVAAKVAWLMGDEGPAWIEQLGLTGCFLGMDGSVQYLQGWPAPSTITSADRSGHQ